MGEIIFAVPKVREGGFYPPALEKRLRSERALTITLAEMYFQRVSTRKVKASPKNCVDWRSQPNRLIRQQHNRTKCFKGGGKDHWVRSLLFTWMPPLPWRRKEGWEHGRRDCGFCILPLVCGHQSATECILGNFAVGRRGLGLKFDHLGDQREGVHIQAENPLSG